MSFLDGFSLFGMGMGAMMFHMMNGMPDDTQVTIHLQDAETGEVFHAVTYPLEGDDFLF